MSKKLLLIFAGIVALFSGLLLRNTGKLDFGRQLSKYTTVELFAAVADAVCNCPPDCGNGKNN